MPIQQGTLKSYSDSNVLKYNSAVVLTRDSEKFYPKSFRVKLPKKIKYYECLGSSDFAFYYNEDQVILIKANLEKSTKVGNSSYIPSDIEMRKFIDQISTSGHKTYDVKKMENKPTRINNIIRKGEATILMYNILETNKKLYLDYLNGFAFLDL